MVIACSCCGATYTSATWREQEAVRTLRQDDVRQHVVAWPATRDVEVRACGTCGRAMARLAPVG